MSRYDPWADLGERYPHVSVQLRELDGVYGLLEGDRITLELHSTQAERRSTLAHEVAHLDRGDGCIGESYPDARRQENRAEEAAHAEAARKLIEIRDLAQAVCIWGDSDLENVAEELWVDLETLLARLDHLHPTERGLVRRALDAKEDAA